MEISGPGHILVRNGLPFNKYEVVERLRTPKGTLANFYFFDKYADAELYYHYLLQVNGVNDIDKAIANKRTYLWEKEELIAFKGTLDLSILENAVKKLEFIKDTVFYEAIPQKRTPQRQKGPIDTPEQQKWHEKFLRYEI